MSSMHTRSKGVLPPDLLDLVVHRNALEWTDPSLRRGPYAQQWRAQAKPPVQSPPAFFAYHDDFEVDDFGNDDFGADDDFDNYDNTNNTNQQDSPTDMSEGTSSDSEPELATSDDEEALAEEFVDEIERIVPALKPNAEKQRLYEIDMTHDSEDDSDSEDSDFEPRRPVILKPIVVKPTKQKKQKLGLAKEKEELLRWMEEHKNWEKNPFIMMKQMYASQKKRYNEILAQEQQLQEKTKNKKLKN